MSQIIDLLYNVKLPKVYREEDSRSGQNSPLYRFLSVFGVGFDSVKQDIDNFTNLFDVEKCPDKYLPLLASSLGIEFPYDMTSREQRRFIKIAPTIYQQKGTIQSFTYIARELTGQKFQADIVENRNWVMKTNSLSNKTFSTTQQISTSSSTVSYIFGPTWNKTVFSLFLTADQETENLNTTYNRLLNLTQYFAPSGTKFNTTTVYFFSDIYSHDNVGESYLLDTVSEQLPDDIYSLPTSETYSSDSVSETVQENVYSAPNFDLSFTNVLQYRTNSTITTPNKIDYTDMVVSNEGLDSYTLSTNQERQNDVVIFNDNAYNFARTNNISFQTNLGWITAEPNEIYHRSSLATENELNAFVTEATTENYPKRNNWESAFTNMLQYQTNLSFYTNSASCVDKIIDVNSGQTTIRLS